GDKIGPPIAGFVEEPGKLVAVIVLASLPRYPWTLNGMCFGAAVGAGFAAFESAGYAFLAAAEGTDAMAGGIALRGMLSPFGHVVWTAVTAGAVWRVKGAANFKFSMLADRRCLAPILVMVALHATWNSSLPAMFPFLLGYFVLGAVAWLVAIGMLLGGVRQVSEAKALDR
ncbi:MAG: PrsW family intramembrane metalloprotease, partial [Phycisphaerales bacterium]|nr:PrsW family intramembrane metalloprotease [Phycisphaerales bacterium]